MVHWQMNGKENVVCILNEIFIHKNETVICSIMDEQETIMLSEISQAWEDKWFHLNVEMKILALKKQRLEQWSLEPGQSFEKGRVEKRWFVGTWA